MARTKQLPHHDVAATTNTITLSDDSESGDDIAVETAPPKGTQQVKGKKNAPTVDTAKKSIANQAVKAMNSAVKSAKGKRKAKVDAEMDDQDMDVDIENLTRRKWPDHALVGPPIRDINVLKRDNEMVCRFVLEALRYGLLISLDGIFHYETVGRGEPTTTTSVGRGPGSCEAQRTRGRNASRNRRFK